MSGERKPGGEGGYNTKLVYRLSLDGRLISIDNTSKR